MNSRFPIINGLTCDGMWKQKESTVVMFFLGGAGQPKYLGHTEHGKSHFEPGISCLPKNPEVSPKNP